MATEHDHHVRIRCDTCGKFISFADCERSRVDFIPLNEFGPEEIEWTCPRCVDAEAV
jgi:hypothetical protein